MQTAPDSKYSCRASLETPSAHCIPPERSPACIWCEHECGMQGCPKHPKTRSHGLLQLISIHLSSKPLLLSLALVLFSTISAWCRPSKSTRSAPKHGGCTEPLAGSRVRWKVGVGYYVDGPVTWLYDDHWKVWATGGLDALQRD